MTAKLALDQVQLGSSSTAANNFVLQTNNDGTLKIARGNAGSTTQDVFTVAASGAASFPQGLADGNVVATAAVNDNSTKPANTAWIWTNIQALVASVIAAVATAAGFAVSRGTNGYIKLPSWLGGVILQWGTGTFPANSTTTVSLPIAFPNAFAGVVTTVRDNIATNSSYPFGTALPLNLSSFSMRAYYTASTITHSWIAIGY